MKNLLKSIVCFVAPAIIILTATLSIIGIAITAFIGFELRFVLWALAIAGAIMASQMVLLVLLRLPVKGTIKSFIEAFFDYGTPI